MLVLSSARPGNEEEQPHERRLHSHPRSPRSPDHDGSVRSRGYWSLSSSFMISRTESKFPSLGFSHPSTGFPSLTITIRSRSPGRALTTRAIRLRTVEIPIPFSQHGHTRGSTSNSRRSSGWNAYLRRVRGETVVITHPGHPLSGKAVAVRHYRPKGRLPSVLVELPDRTAQCVPPGICAPVNEILSPFYISEGLRRAHELEMLHCEK